MQSAEKWFTSVEELNAGFRKGTFEQSIVFRTATGSVPFQRRLKKIILDDPQVQRKGVDVYSMAYGALRYAKAISNVKAPIVRRPCGGTCRCREEYSEDLIEKFFYPVLT